MGLGSGTAALALLLMAQASDGGRAARAAGDKLLAAAEAAERDDCATAARLAGEVIDPAPAAKLPEELRLVGAELAADCEAKLGRIVDGHRHAMAATTFVKASDHAWTLRLVFELRKQDDAAAVATLEAMTRGRGAALNGLPLRLLYEFDQRLRTTGAGALRRRFLAVVTGEGYLPDEPGGEEDGFLQRRAELLHADGDVAGAAALVGRIEHPSVLIDLSLDPRFRAPLPPGFDVRPSVERALARARTDAARRPELIRPVVDAATFLRVLGRPREAVDALEALRPRIANPEAFADRADRLVWWWDGLSQSHAMLGEHAEAVDALRRGGETEENGDLNVSQVINLAELQRTLGRPADTIATLSAFDAGTRDVSPYGTMQIVANRGCAKATLSGPAAAAADLAYARAHAADAPDALFGLLLCVRDLDGAAAALVAQLDDPERRAPALRNLSDYDDPPVALPPDPADAALRIVKARPEVRAAIARAGGTRRFRIQNVSF